MEKLLRFVEEPDVGLFDNVVAAFYQGTPQQVRINKNKKKKIFSPDLYRCHPVVLPFHTP
jgi:hypothetical protein